MQKRTPQKIVSSFVTLGMVCGLGMWSGTSVAGNKRAVSFCLGQDTDAWASVLTGTEVGITITEVTRLDSTKGNIVYRGNNKVGEGAGPEWTSKIGIDAGDVELEGGKCYHLAFQSKIGGAGSSDWKCNKQNGSWESDGITVTGFYRTARSRIRTGTLEVYGYPTGYVSNGNDLNCYGGDLKGK